MKKSVVLVLAALLLGALDSRAAECCYWKIVNKSDGQVLFNDGKTCSGVSDTYKDAWTDCYEKRQSMGYSKRTAKCDVQRANCSW